MKASVGGYARARDVRHAIDLLGGADGTGRVLAGGQSLIAAMNMGLSAGDMLVDITGIAALRGTRVEGERLVIGALTRHVEIAADPLIAEHAPLLARAVPFIAHDAIRNRGTIGGSIAHADPAAEFPACALALGATILLEGPDGRREVAADNFFVEVFETAIAEGEILTAIAVPLASQGGRFDLVVVDEAHKSRGIDSSLSRILGPVTWKDENAFCLGLTATPVKTTPGSGSTQSIASPGGMTA